jgi:methylenetetrahydrofolate dehydrogenase (NADP+)/methenyltetrahydrofolate cyclohydrolase
MASAGLLKGSVIAERIKEEIRSRIGRLGFRPALAGIQVGDNAAAGSYTQMQSRLASALGFDYRLHKLAARTSLEDLKGLIDRLNLDAGVNGIIIQKPLPNEIDYLAAVREISPLKDVEGMHPYNIGHMFFPRPRIVPCTPAAVMELIKLSGVRLEGREAVVIGHSEIVGRPLALLLLDKLATVTVCHIGTDSAGKLQEHVSRAEILVVAVGKAGIIKGKWVKEGAVVIDVGINRSNGMIVGDVETAEAASRASWITPVPGGVGPVTAAILMRNFLEAASMQKKQPRND